VCGNGVTCLGGLCTASKLAATPATSIALIGTNLYLAHSADTDIGVVDLNAETPAETTFLLGSFNAPFRKMSAYDGKLWVSTEKEQAIVETSKTVSANFVVSRANTTENGGIFYPGSVPFYTYRALEPSKLTVAQLSDNVMTFGPYAMSAVAVSDGQFAYATGRNVFRLPDSQIIQTGTELPALGVTADSVYFAENGNVFRATKDHAEAIALEPGTGVKFTVVGDTLYYTAHRNDASTGSLRERDVLVRVKTCGGPPLVLYDQGGSTISDFVIADSYAFIANGDGVWRVAL
jgi:hypothetical protein